MKEINDNVQRMKMESNIDERVLQAMRDAEERMRKVASIFELSIAIAVIKILYSSY